MPFFHTDRGRFFYRLGPGHAPTLVFLHGNLGSSRWWKPTLERLPQGWHGIAIDQLGAGYSDKSDRADRYSIPELAADLAACMAALSTPRVHLVAHSTSTPVAIHYALNFPQQVATLTLVGPVPVTGATTPPEAYPLLERLPQDAQLRARALHASLPALAPDDPLLRQFDLDLSQTAPLRLVALARGLDAWQPGGPMRQLSIPVLLIRGSLDMMLSAEEAQQTLLAIPTANNLEVLHGSGHSPMVEQPQIFAEVLVRFIADDWEAYDAVRRSAG